MTLVTSIFFLFSHDYIEIFVNIMLLKLKSFKKNFSKKYFNRQFAMDRAMTMMATVLKGAVTTRFLNQSLKSVVFSCVISSSVCVGVLDRATQKRSGTRTGRIAEIGSSVMTGTAAIMVCKTL